MIIGYDASRAFVAQSSGTENYSFQLLKALLELRSKHEFHLYLRPPYDEKRLVEIRRFPQVKLISLNYRYFWTQLGLAWQTWKKPPAVLFIPAHVVPLIKKFNLPTVVTVHDLALEFLPYYGSWRQRLYLGWTMERWRARLARHLIAVSQFTKQEIIKKLGVRPEKITVIYEGVESGWDRPLAPSDYKRIRRKFNLPQSYLLFVSTLQPRKNIVRLIRAFKKVTKENPSLSLVIVGKKGWGYEEIFNTVDELGLQTKVRFLGYVERNDLRVLYAGAKAFCLPSLHEGFGLPVLEAMSLGTPVIISNCSSLPEIGGRAAIYFDPYRVEDIAAAIHRLCRASDKEYQNWRFLVKQRARQFSWHKAAQETLKVLEKVAGENSANY